MSLSVEKAVVEEKPIHTSIPAPAGYTVSIRPSRVVKALLVITAILVVLNLLAIFVWLFGGYEQALGFVPGFYLEKESNVPTLFSSLILLLASALFGLIAQNKKKKKKPYVFHWGLLAATFLYMSMDEIASFHERLVHPLRSSLKLSGIFYFSWVVLAIVFLIAFAAYYLKFFFSLSNKFRAGFFISGFIYVSGAVGMELIGGYYAERFGMENITYALITSLEESLELVGILLLIKYLFEYLRDNTKIGAIQLSLKK